MSSSFSIVTRINDNESFDNVTIVDPAKVPVIVADENSLGKLLWIMIYGVTAVLIAVNFPRFFNVVRKDKLLLLLNLLGMISVSWSEDPWLSARGGLVLFLTYAFGSYLACRYTERQFLDVFGASAFWCCLTCLALGVFVPRLGVMSDLHEGSWRGMFTHKNILGRFMAAFRPWDCSCSACEAVCVPGWRAPASSSRSSCSAFRDRWLRSRCWSAWSPSSRSSGGSEDAPRWRSSSP